MNKEIVPNVPGDVDPSYANQGALVVPPAEAGEFEGLNGVTILLPNGKVLTAGIRIPGPYLQLLQFDANGAPDTTFGNEGVVELSAVDARGLSVTDLVATTDDRVLLCASRSLTLHVMRVTRDGALDSTFGQDGIATAALPEGVSVVSRLVRLQSGHVLVCLNKGRASSILVRFTGDGVLDLSFGEQGFVPVAPAYIGGELVVLDDDSILGCGSLSGAALLAKYRSNGTLDPAFGSAGLFTVEPEPPYPALFNGVAVQPDAMLVILGEVENINRKNQAFVARVNAEGQSDLTFNSGNPLVIGELVNADKAITADIQADGKILVLGNALGGLTQGVMFRLHPDGTPDESFSHHGAPFLGPWRQCVEVGITDSARRLKLTAEGKIFVSGFTLLELGGANRASSSRYLQ